MTPGPKLPPDCPICGAMPAADGSFQHIAERHQARHSEDWGEIKPRDRERIVPGLYVPPGDPTIPAYVRSLMQRKPELADQILAEFQAGLRGEQPDAPPQLSLLPKAADAPELQRPRRPFGYSPED